MPTIAPKGPGAGPPPPGESGEPSISRKMLLVLALMLGAMWFWKSTTEGGEQATVVYSQLFDWIKEGKVESIVLAGDTVDATLKKPESLAGKSVKTFHTNLPPNDPALLPLMRDKSVEISVKSQRQPFAVQLVMTLLPWALIIGAWIWMSRRARGMLSTGGPLGGFLKSPGRKFDKTTSVNVTFEDIAGLKAAKNDLLEIVEFMKTPDRFRRLGGKVPRGVLLVGPPGTGKTLLARAVAGESGVPFFSISASEFIELFVGLGASRVRDLFKEAKKSAPAIIFIDEIDAVGRSRGAGLGGGNDEREQTLNQLLSEMDGFDRTDMAVVMAATNRPDVLDPALLRPGRFDRRILVDRPEMAARKAILGVHAKGKPLAADVDLQSVAENTAGFSGADLANLVNEAALSATRTGRDSITAEDFAAAFDKIVLGDLRETKLDAKEKRRVAVHESGHALVAHFSPDVEPPHRVSIIPRGMALGVTHQSPGTDRHVMAETELLSRIRVLMGGYAAERLALESVSTGAENDLKEATRLASRMVANFGMSERLGPVYYDHEAEHPFLGQRVAIDGATSAATAAAIEEEARKILGTALDQATKLLQEHREALERLWASLLDRESLDRGELQAVLGPRQSTGGQVVEWQPPHAGGR
ncbi:MAG TPA: ATP-dependent zinc metalloprotease FtsH [Gemmatimonadaceae bacterium]|nr:ATP-dependent zinc metalloprotease FtsH [Gemmatimonadaceae bacterium]